MMPTFLAAMTGIYFGAFVHLVETDQVQITDVKPSVVAMEVTKVAQSNRFED